MPKYQKRPEHSSVYIPGYGRLSGDRVIQGDYDHFVPALLVKVEEPSPPPAPSKPTETLPPREEAVTTQIDTDTLKELVASEKAAAGSQGKQGRGGKSKK